MPHRPRSLVRLTCAAAVSLSALAACGGDDGGGGGADDPEGFEFEAARRCTDVVNGIDRDAVTAAQDANFEVIEAVLTDEELSAADLERIHDQLVVLIDVRTKARDQLADLEPDGDGDAQAWAAIVDGAGAEIDLFTERAELLAGGDWEAISAGYRPAGVDDDADAVQAALEDLRMVGRDCENVASTRGIPADHADFVTSASNACTTIVSRRLADGYSTDLVLGVVEQVYSDEPVEVSDELREQIDAVAEEWRLTQQDLARVDTGDVPDESGWQGVLDAAQERVDVFEARKQALEDGDTAEIVRLFTPGEVWEHPGLIDDAEALYLDTRDCRSIQS